MDQFVSAFLGLDETARMSLMALAAIVGLIGLLIGLMLRRKPEQIETMKPGLLGSCGAATLRCRVVPDLRFTELSADIETVTGYSADVLLQDDAFLRMLEESDAQHFESRARKAVQDEHPMVADLRYFDADGRLRWMQIRAEPSVDPKGRSRGLVGILREITEQKSLAADAANAWARYHALAEATPTMLWLLDETLSCHATNSASERFAGLAEDQLLGESWIEAFAPEQREAVEKYLLRQLEESSAAQRDTVMIDAHGRNRNVVIHATIVRDESSGQAHIVLVGRDVTDRSEGEKQLDRMRRLVDASEPSTMILAPDMRVTMLNPAGRELIGLGDRQAADSLALWHIVTKDTVDEIRSEGIKACAEGGLWKGTGQLRCSEDESVAAEITVVALGDGWHGLIAREIEGELRREADAALDRRRLTVALGAIERLSGGGWAPGRSTERIVESISRHYPELRATYASFGDDGSIIVEASDGPAWMGSAKGRITTIDPDGSLFQRLRDNEIVKIADVWDEPELNRGVLGLEETMARSLAVVLVDPGDHSTGLMLFERPDVYEWTSDET
ncbi:MAG TPA: PAS domain S-box protein, partial [Phycisphaerales bacterium]|nr:PAS domain S-box protein [Phycisphaerales bacterium]